MSFYLEDLNEIEIRTSLMKYYSSESMTHGAFILTATIGLFTFFQAKNELVKTITIVHPKTLTSLVLGFLLSLLFYFMIRTIFWSAISSYALHVLPKKSEDLPLNALYRLHKSCLDLFKQHHPVMNFLAGPTREAVSQLILYATIAICTAAALYLIF
jgi:hypothetical protein